MALKQYTFLFAHRLGFTRTIIVHATQLETATEMAWLRLTSARHTWSIVAMVAAALPVAAAAAEAL